MGEKVNVYVYETMDGDFVCVFDGKIYPFGDLDHNQELAEDIVKGRYSFCNYPVSDISFYLHTYEVEL